MGFSTYNYFSSLGIKTTFAKNFSVHKNFLKKVSFSCLRITEISRKMLNIYVWSIKNYTLKHRNNQSTNILWILSESMYIFYSNLSKNTIIIRLNTYVNFNDKPYIINETFSFINLRKEPEICLLNI